MCLKGCIVSLFGNPMSFQCHVQTHGSLVKHLPSMQETVNCPSLASYLYSLHHLMVQCGFACLLGVGGEVAVVKEVVYSSFLFHLFKATR